MLRLTALTAFSLPLAGALCASAAAEATASVEAASPLKLGVASYSLANSTPDQVIAALKSLRINYVSLYKTHCPWAGSAEECRAAARKFTDAGLTVTGSGVIDLPNNEAALRKAFENAKAAGLPTMVCKPALDAFPLVEKFVKEFDQRLAIHNHGPEDKVYPSPYIAWDAIQPYDQRIGLCIDVGHAARSGADPVEAIRKCHSRLYDVHLKDSLAAVGATKDEPTEVGRGKLDIKGMLAALIELKYEHIVAFEYEKRSSDPVAGLAESVAYVRKVVAGLAK
jgi:sugar phosphate isomerase/epimerase